MSWRLYVQRTDGEKMQLFGNNELPEEFLEALREQGLEYDSHKDDYFVDFKIKEIQPLVNAIKKFLTNKHKDYEAKKEIYKGISKMNGDSIFDFLSNFTFNGELKEGFYMTSCDVVENCYAFLLYNFIEFLKDDIDFKNSDCYEDEFTLKENADIRFDWY